MQKLIKRTLTISLLTSSLLMASGTQTDELNTQAVDLIKQNNATKAYSILETAYLNGEYNNQTLFLLGTSAKQNGDAESAIKYFEELLSKDGSAQRIRLDLAVLYYKKQNLEKAKELLLVVKASNPPKKVGDNIEKFLVTIDKGVPKNYSLFANIGYIVDSNANQATADDTIILNNGRNFNLSDDAQKTRDTAVQYGFGINHIKTFGSNYALQSSAVINMVNYNKLDELDSSSLSASVAPTWKQNKKTTISIPLIANVIKYGHEDRYYSRSMGIAPQINYMLQPNLSLTTSLVLNWKDYYKQADKESDSWTFSPSAKYLINQSSWVSVGAYIGAEDSKTSSDSNDMYGINLGYYKGLTKEANLYLSTSYNDTSYDDSLDFFDKKREDKKFTVSGNISYFVDQIKSNISLNLSHTKNDSNLELFEYTRDVVSINLGYRF